jgi:hypothetical protein
LEVMMRPLEVFARSLGHDEAVRLMRLSTPTKAKSAREGTRVDIPNLFCSSVAVTAVVDAIGCLRAGRRPGRGSQCECPGRVFSQPELHCERLHDVLADAHGENERGLWVSSAGS